MLQETVDMINIALSDALGKIKTQKDKIMGSYGQMGGLF